MIATVFGVSIYYLLPLSLLSMNIGLLINIFFWILIGLLLGFVLLSLNIQHLLEKLTIFIAFFIISIPYYIVLPFKKIRPWTYISSGLKLLV